MGFFEELTLRLFWGRIEKGLRTMFGTGWKGKVGAIGVMIAGGIGILQGLGCVLGIVAADNLVLSNFGGCWTQVTVGAATFASGLSQFGIRDAIGRPPTL